ncbi:Rap1a/Tai family immunity protein [Arsukibacterium indicum]|uniref:Rap1a immunity protein domain-containing protein n=1 Tax=Arsukibacterium indicum TaxID=2848612 RepID=A0ABS6MHP7_9GAMM|nr:Rap1a/Tai family immunity protein [Arsukibacterium indicum]MBV2128145.1 hypothetical protein [Arsukibacterium indicum]
MKYLILLLALPVMVSAKPASSDSESFPHFMSGNELFASYSHEKSKSTDYFERGIFLGFILGAMDVGRGKLFCLPSNISAKQAADTIGKYLTDNPERRHFSGARLVAEALNEHYPCEKPD